MHCTCDKPKLITNRSYTHAINENGATRRVQWRHSAAAYHWWWKANTGGPAAFPLLTNQSVKGLSCRTYTWDCHIQFSIGVLGDARLLVLSWCPLTRLLGCSAAPGLPWRMRHTTAKSTCSWRLQHKDTRSRWRGAQRAHRSRSLGETAPTQLFQQLNFS